MSKFKKTLKNVRDRATSNLTDRINHVVVRQEELGEFVRGVIALQKQASAYSSIAIMPISEREIAVKIFNDLIMYLDPRDLAVVPHIALERIWEREITYAWLSVLNRPHATVVDIGANFGYYGMLAAQRLDKKKGKVILFEPNNDLLPYVRKTLSVNWLNENTVIEELALSDSEGGAELNVLEDYVGSSSMHSIEHLDKYLGHQMHLKAQNVLKIKTTTLDAYCAEHNIDGIDFIKMDIEGYEEAAYKGMSKMVKKSPQLTLFVEFTKNSYEDPRKFFSHLQRDFKHLYTIDQNGVLIEKTGVTYDDLMDGVDVLIFLVFSKKELAQQLPL